MSGSPRLSEVDKKKTFPATKHDEGENRSENAVAECVQCCPDSVVYSASGRLDQWCKSPPWWWFTRERDEIILTKLSLHVPAKILQNGTSSVKAIVSGRQSWSDGDSRAGEPLRCQGPA